MQVQKMMERMFRLRVSGGYGDIPLIVSGSVAIRTPTIAQKNTASSNLFFSCFILCRTLFRQHATFTCFNGILNPDLLKNINMLIRSI